MRRRTEEEKRLADRAFQYLPGGSLGNVYTKRGEAFYIKRGKGSRVWDVSGNEYIDFILGGGPMRVGHAHPEVVAAVREQVERGSTYAHDRRANSLPRDGTGVGDKDIRGELNIDRESAAKVATRIDSTCGSPLQQCGR